jgi:hypothetical protein
MAFELVCVHPFHDHRTGRLIQRGETITDPAEVERHRFDRDHHFVKREVPDPAKPEAKE